MLRRRIFAYHFFSSRAASVLSVDSTNAIAHAKRNFRAPNVEYRCADIRTDMPEGEFDNVVGTCNRALHVRGGEGNPDQHQDAACVAGTLSGYTIVERVSGKSLSHHEYEYKSKEELAMLLKQFFGNVLVFENTSRDQIEERRNLYFLPRTASCLSRIGREIRLDCENSNLS